MHLAEDGGLERRQRGSNTDNDGQPWWCFFWPPACKTSTSSRGSTPTTTSTRRKTSTTTPNNPPPTTTIRTSAPPTTPPPATQPAPTPPGATPPALTPPAPTPPAPTPSTKETPEPPPQGNPPPTSEAQPSPPRDQPAPTNTGGLGPETTSIDPVVVHPGSSSGNMPGTGNGEGANPTTTQGLNTGVGVGDANGSGTGSGSGTSTGDHASPGSGSEVPTAFDPSSSAGAETTGIGGGSSGDHSGTGGSGTGDAGTSGGGFPPGAIAGTMVSLLLLLALLALLLYRFRRSPAVQRLLAPLGMLGAWRRDRHRDDTPGPYGTGRDLLSPSPAVGAMAGAAGAYDRSSQVLPYQAPMKQTSSVHLVVPPAAARRERDSNRVSVSTKDSVAGTGFTPSPVSPISSADLLSPGAVRSSRPVREPPDPRITADATAHVRRGSATSLSTGSGISAALSPGQMAWPMPPNSPSAIHHPDGPHYLNFQQTGETVVRINQPPRSNRR
ncbi:hypothetical protein N658DRAFT_317090 [Parathielavia hyrcaniae]|uniref:Uncharacterized protein n=1 Tax=Parathielavia hyrcaniae TaxID=113614 RepID=A0AAN6SX01_9PEZI|nr:hypothetical protein N658DRAFT_317090 [Parathielavia hyrcaniae]